MTDAPGRAALYETRVAFDDFRLTISSLTGRRELPDLKDRTGALMISVKNKSFTNRLIESFCRFTSQHLERGIVIVVDEPYAANIEATESRSEARANALERLARIGEENARRVEKILARHRPVPIELQSWAEAEGPTPRWLVDELEQAFASGGRVKRDVLARTREVLPDSVPDDRLEAYSQFLIRELPVLFDVYYRRFTRGVVDVYPGENPELVWNLERGVYADELPGATRLAREGPSLAYVDFREEA
jgi:hypothetical protein